jgi:hypothetical protein
MSFWLDNDTKALNTVRSPDSTKHNVAKLLLKSKENKRPILKQFCHQHFRLYFQGIHFITKTYIFYSLCTWSELKIPTFVAMFNKNFE